MSFGNQMAAQEAGHTMLHLLKGKGWKGRVWENIGWHVAAYNGPIHVMMNVYNSGPPTYSCLVSDSLSDSIGGNGEWTTKFTSEDPNEAVAHEVASAREHINKWTAAVEFAEDVIKDLPGKEELTLRLENGWSLRLGPGAEHVWGNYVRVCDKYGEEVLYYDHAEWAEAPEEVMGAFLACAFNRLPPPFDRTTKEEE